MRTSGELRHICVGSRSDQADCGSERQECFQPEQIAVACVTFYDFPKESGIPKSFEKFMTFARAVPTSSDKDSICGSPLKLTLADRI